MTNTITNTTTNLNTDEFDLDILFAPLSVKPKAKNPVPFGKVRLTDCVGHITYMDEMKFESIEDALPPELYAGGVEYGDDPYELELELE